jgi:hypothetical protein
LAVSTNAVGAIISVTGMYTQEFDTLPGFPAFSADPDSWSGGVLEMSGFVAQSKNGAGNSNIQIDKKNILPITITGNDDLNVSCIDPASLLLGPGEFYTLSTLGGLKHVGGHLAGNTFDGHFPSEDADLRCGLNQVRLRGTCDGVPFVTSVEVNGIGKACDL